MKVKEAVKIAHTLSNPSKMPGKGYNLNPLDCKVGSRLRKIKGSVCEHCYACKGRYVFDNTQEAMNKRGNSITDPRWVQAMSVMIKNQKWFRWHDAGDIQDVDHLKKIAQIARNTPNTQHWLPTREYGIITDFFEGGNTIPDNLNIRLSAHMIDGKTPDTLAEKYGLTVSGVSSKGGTCPAPEQGGECKDCRACWNRGTFRVDYHVH
jgi:hypothetical protein